MRCNVCGKAKDGQMVGRGYGVMGQRWYSEEERMEDGREKGKRREGQETGNNIMCLTTSISI